MDTNQFDRLTRMLGGPASRRGVLAALVSAGLAGPGGLTAAKTKRRKGKQGRKAKAKAKPAVRVTTEAADCLSPGPSSNMNGCNFNNRDFSGQDLSSSTMVGTRFRGANLCGTDLRSSQLKNADLRGFAAAGNATNLTRADLSSSGCTGIQFNARTLFCQTRTCNGQIRNDDCPQGVAPQDICCGDTDCAVGRQCDAATNTCRTVCNATTCATGCCTANGVCVTPPTNHACGIGGGACLSCTGTTPVCNVATGTCVQCTSDGHCDTLDTECVDATCNTTPGPGFGTCVAKNRSDFTTKCQNNTGVCCSGLCQIGNCCDGDHCENPTPICANANGVNTCVPCTTNAPCAPRANRCAQGGNCECGIFGERSPCAPDQTCLGLDVSVVKACVARVE